MGRRDMQDLAGVLALWDIVSMDSGYGEGNTARHHMVIVGAAAGRQVAPAADAGDARGARGAEAGVVGCDLYHWRGALVKNGNVI